MRYGIIFKKNGSKMWQGSQIAKKGVSKSQLESFRRRNTKKGFTVKVVTEGQINALKKQMRALISKFKSKRGVVRRRTRPKRVIRRKRVKRVFRKRK